MSVTLYTTTWCPFCQKLTADLDATGTAYDRVDVEENPDAGEWVKSVNDGNRVVPTVQYSDGTHATNPSGDEVREKLASLES